MQILYVDSSGDEGWPPPYGKSDCEHHVTIGLSIDAKKWIEIATKTQDVFTNYFPDPTQRPKEFHYSELVGGKGKYGALSGQERKALADSILQIIVRVTPTLFAIVIKKSDHYVKYLIPSGPKADRPGRIGITYLIPRFNMFLKRNHEVGCMVNIEEGSFMHMT